MWSYNSTLGASGRGCELTTLIKKKREDKTVSYIGNTRSHLTSPYLTQLFNNKDLNCYKVSFNIAPLLVSCLIDMQTEPTTELSVDLYLEPVRKGSSFDLIQPEKRSRLFVGKRFSDDYLSDDEDLLPLSSEDNDEPLYVKSRSHLFVGRRASPRFVGKRMARKKRFASNEYGRDENMEDSDEGRMWKLWMTPGSGEVGNTVADKRSRLFVGDKRSRLFVGKRRELEADDKKRSRLFVGRRAEAEEEKRDSGIALPAEVELSEADKRSRLFVGKRHPGDQPSSHSSERFGTEKEPDEMPSSPRAAGESTDDKRVHLFPGKRPAPGFVGKREE